MWPIRSTTSDDLSDLRLPKFHVFICRLLLWHLARSRSGTFLLVVRWHCAMTLRYSEATQCCMCSDGTVP